MIQYADFGHYSTPEWCPNVQLYIKYKTQHTSFGQPSETIFLKNLRNSLVFNALPQNKKILPPQLNRKEARRKSGFFRVFNQTTPRSALPLRLAKNPSSLFEEGNKKKYSGRRGHAL